MELRFEHEVPLPVDRVFRFHESPDNLAVLLRGWPGFSILRNDGHILPGACTWVRQSVAGLLNVVMGFRHTVYEPPFRFAEEMFHGPYRTFAHTHEFEAVAHGTRIRDRLLLELPWCYGGELGTRALIAPWMHRFFAHRQRRWRELASAERSGGSQ